MCSCTYKPRNQILEDLHRDKCLLGAVQYCIGHLDFGYKFHECIVEQNIYGQVSVLGVIYCVYIQKASDRVSKSAFFSAKLVAAFTPM